MGEQRVLLAEDDATVSEVVRRYLELAGLTVEVVADGSTALERALADPPDLIVLDLMLPGLPGLEVCRRLRAVSAVPIVMLTALGEEADRVLGLEMGADDYVTKPFSPRELVARVKTVLRRTRGAGQASPLLRVGRVSLDPDRRRAHVDEAEVVLTTTEFDLLAFLLRRPGRVYERDHLLSEVWGYAAAAGTRTVDVHVAQLRAKLGDASPIRTVRGVGYSAEA